MLAAVKQNGLALKFAADHLKADREIVLAAVSQFGNAIEYAAESLRTDSEVTAHHTSSDKIIQISGLKPCACKAYVAAHT